MALTVVKSHLWDAPGTVDTDPGIDLNMWSRRHWPFLELEDGDVVFTVTGGSPSKGTIKNECRVDHVVKSAYSTHEEAWSALLAGLPVQNRKNDRLNKQSFLRTGYTVNAPQEGWVLAMVLTPLRSIGAPRPVGSRFRPNGWARWENPGW